MEKADKPQICSNLSSRLAFSLPFIILGFFALFPLFFFFPISESSPFLLTIPIALLSTLFLVTLRKKKVSLDENLVQDTMQKEEFLQVNAERETGQITEQQQEAESQSDSSFPSDSESNNGSSMEGNFEVNAQKHQQEESDSSLPSDSESITGSIQGESFELDDHNSNEILGICNSFASENEEEEGDDEEEDQEEEEDEEDSLIEINLPSSHFSGITEEHNQKLQSAFPDFLPESMFKQQGLMELLAEINDMNEDENLIEIDISMGSTPPCQDLRLKQETAILGDQCGVHSD